MKSVAEIFAEAKAREAKGFNRKPKLTKDQRAALKAYNFAVQQEDRYMGSVFVTSIGAAQHEEKVKYAYDKCLALGMNWEHGL